MKSYRILFLFALWTALSGLVPLGGTSANGDGEPKDLPILQAWSGQYPVARLDRLPAGQRTSRVGYIGDAATFVSVWQAFEPDAEPPFVDFSTHLVVFFRNVDFYNRTAIAKVTLEDGVAEVIAMETMSAMPIEDKVAMVLAVIPCEGVEFIQAGSERIPVTADESAVDPLNATYTIERHEVRLVNGRHEVQAGHPALPRKSGPGSSASRCGAISTTTAPRMRPCSLYTPLAAAEPSIMSQLHSI